jgi:hypothetical protein
VSAESLGEMLGFIDSGRFVRGATVLRYDWTPLAWKPILLLSNVIVFLLRWTSGCFAFCRADSLSGVRWVTRSYSPAKTWSLAGQCRCWGKPRRLRLATVRRHPPITSIRKLELYGTPL